MKNDKNEFSRRFANRESFFNYDFDDVHLAWKAGISCKQTEIESLQAKIKELEAQIEEMKNCDNCIGCDDESECSCSDKRAPIP